MEKKKTMKDCCGSGEALKAYLREKAMGHNSYKCYSRMERIRPIVRDRVLYLNNGQGWNDLTDRANLERDGGNRVYFAKCFSFSVDENVAMWMLYGGIHHTGAMVDFTKAGMNSILKVPKIELGYFSAGQFHAAATVEQPDFEAWVTDIVYCNEQTGYLKRSDETCRGVEQSVLQELGSVKKAYPWNYENECRLIFAVDKQLVPSNCNTMKIDLSSLELGKSLSRAYYCPGYQGKAEEGFRNSQLNGTIEWDLRDEKCRTCTL